MLHCLVGGDSYYLAAQSGPGRVVKISTPWGPRPLYVPWVFLLFDSGGRVQDYRFLSFDDLREMERAEVEEKQRAGE